MYKCKNFQNVYSNFIFPYKKNDFATLDIK